MVFEKLFCKKNEIVDYAKTGHTQNLSEYHTGCSESSVQFGELELAKL